MKFIKLEHANTGVIYYINTSFIEAIVAVTESKSSVRVSTVGHQSTKQIPVDKEAHLIVEEIAKL